MNHTERIHLHCTNISLCDELSTNHLCTNLLKTVALANLLGGSKDGIVWDSGDKSDNANSSADKQ